jgi:bifunctional DNA-binding transcriptional regulator/antitoxin component of YhaV-PrlF toxin-antitoxin module
MKPVIFKNNILQREKRVKLPDPVIDFLGIKEGDRISIILEPDKDEVIIKKDKNK